MSLEIGDKGNMKSRYNILIAYNTPQGSGGGGIRTHEGSTPFPILSRFPSTTRTRLPALPWGSGFPRFPKIDSITYPLYRTTVLA